MKKFLKRIGCVLLATIFIFNLFPEYNVSAAVNWKKLYREEVSARDCDEETKFRLLHVDNDRIPELFVQGVYGDRELLTISDGKVKSLVFSNMGSISFSSNGKGVINEYHSGGGGYQGKDYWYDCYYKLKKGKLVERCYQSYNCDCKGYAYRVKGKTASKSKYNKIEASFTKKAKMISCPKKLYTKSQILKQMK